MKKLFFAICFLSLFCSFKLSAASVGYVPISRTVNGHALTTNVTVSKSDLSLGNVENTALSTWAGSSNLTTVGTLGQNLLVNGSSYIYGAPTARSLKQSTGTNATLNISALIQNATELTATGTATYGARGLSVGINGNNFGTGTIALIGVVGEPIVTSSSATSKIGLTGLQGRAFRGNVNDKSSDSANSLTGVLGFSGHQALLPQTALTNAVKSGVFTMTSLSGTITTAEAGEFNVNVGNTAGTTANVTTAYGIKTAATVGASSGSATSTLSTYYAAFLGSPLVNSKGVLTTNWGLYQESTAAKNYFGSKVGIGNTSPAYALDVIGTANATEFKTATGTSTQWDTGYAQRNYWDGGATGLNAATAKTSLSLNNVENTALSTWAGSTNVNTVGTLNTTLVIETAGTTKSVPLLSTNLTTKTKLAVYPTATDSISSGSNSNRGSLYLLDKFSNTGTGRVASIGIDSRVFCVTSNIDSPLLIEGAAFQAIRASAADISRSSQNTLYGLLVSSGHTSGASVTANTTNSYNLYSQQNATNGHIDNGYAHYTTITAGVAVNSSGNYTTVYGSNVLTTAGATSGTGTGRIGTLVGHKLSTPIVNATGAIGTEIGFWQESSTAKNIFGGKVGIGTTAPSTALHVAGDKIRIATAKTPSSASDTGDAGDICWDASYVYVCVATNTWKRSAIGAW